MNANVSESRDATAPLRTTGDGCLFVLGDEGVFFAFGVHGAENCNRSHNGVREMLPEPESAGNLKKQRALARCFRPHE